MFLKLAALFILVPTIELVVLIFIGASLGPVPTTLIIIATGLLGTWLAKREGTGVLNKLKRDIEKGVPPAAHITEGVLILAGGLLLLTPGVFTDLTGFMLIVPWTRTMLAPVILRAVASRFVPGGTSSATAWRVDFGAQKSTQKPESTKPPVDPFDHPVA
jgi:UPF0716 protein FxsA